VWLGMAAFAGLAAGQEFEVVSVKPNRSGSNGSHTNTDQGRLTASNLSLKRLIVMAFGMRDYQIEGPDWINSERFDISAKFPEALPKDREAARAALNSMMQKMLIDRFKLAVHREQKIFPVYALIPAKGGIKIKEVPDSGSHSSNSNNGHYEGTCVNMAGFADFLARNMDMPVLDMTGLKGCYDMKLDWVAESRQPVESRPDAPGPVFAENATGLTLPAALQEHLGLKLEARKAPIEILVLDHAEKTATEN
jgi:uncharacterized protein (TIGR03435 family)